MDDAGPLYPQLVLEHRRNPRNRGRLDACTHAADGVNPLCGDRLRIELRCVDGRIAEEGGSDLADRLEDEGYDRFTQGAPLV